ncbi:DUF1853 family protein [Vibrio vulnificus]|uniref:DUF1853 family protein n=1 Tax=Vibrio vulnificus TaxID=672 RepID=UPI001CDCF820|nr:DUF1853 family protein [Vibrio vulnificus]MCA3959452.1 DUF1853 family protein [Vibrio vulnificus]HDY7700384.1 DUF1853 family protein [Vibrio vulnificus]HDY7764435.1 DUF1853 family protein [Vibrio vulnificus]HDY7782537.1 DUF1853 family protein [Vibrio vulnificus]HDY7791701.1 DUF1853 family protein [Vibrio vulnificus]
MMESQLRFLHWILHSPSLFELKPPFAQLQPLDVSLPSALPPYQGNKRLGFLYQHLCSTLFQNTNTIDFIEEELQLKDHQRTLGAIDFMLRNTAESSYQHWEVAIKFYLLCDGLWYGPNAKDRLDKKLSHMLNHQLKMSSNEAFLATHPQYRNCSEHLLMQGRLYINPFLDQVIPQECLGYRLNAQVITGYWCFAHQWPQIPEPLYALEKHDWAVGTREFDTPIQEPQDRFVHAQSKSGQFWFIVPDNWPHNGM